MQWFLLASLGFLTATDQPAAKTDSPSPQALIERHEKEKAPVWVEGDTATFFFRGEAEQVRLFLGGEDLALRRLADSDVWTVSVTKPGLAKGLFTYALLPGKKGEQHYGKKLDFRRWRGPQAPPAAARVEKVRGEVKAVDFDSKALGAKRGVRVYLPPGHDRAKRYPVLYATDGNAPGHIVEALIDAGTVPPMIVVAATPGGYLGERTGGHDVKKDLRAMEYLPGIDAERYAKHEKFFCEELVAWAEAEFGASTDRRQRAVFGCSNGARFAVEMGVAHPDLFGHVIAFSVAGRRDVKLPDGAKALPTFHLAAGTWETGFHGITAKVAEGLKKQNAPVTFVSRVAGHDMAMWEDELAAALVRAFGKHPA
jgi:enterochelin esterase-like enzyme